MWKFIFSLCLSCSAQVFSPELIGTIAPAASSDSLPPVAGYIVWLDAGDPSTMFTNVAGTIQATGSVNNASKFVAKWQDKSIVSGGTNSVFMAIPGIPERRPALSNSLACFNNRPALIFAHRDFTTEERTWLQSETNKTILGTTGITVFAVGQYNIQAGTAGSQFDMLWTYGDGDTWELRRQNVSTNMESIGPAGGVPDPILGLRSDIGNCWITRCFNFNGAGGNNLTIWRNMTASNSASFNDAAWWPRQEGYCVGARWSTAARDNCWHGAIAEIIVYPWAMSIAEIASVNTYLTNKFKLHDP